jgi:hypothetical protein
MLLGDAVADDDNHVPILEEEILAARGLHPEDGDDGDSYQVRKLFSHGDLSS